MHFQFLTEDRSGECFIEQFMKKILQNHSDVTYNCHCFHGIGGFNPKLNAKEAKTGKLLNDLAIYLRGFDKSLQGIHAVILVIDDNDDKDTDVFFEELENVANDSLVLMDRVFCIAVEELEAWLLGDEHAVLQAYPAAKIPVLRAYQQDSICGTWETLANAVYKGGYAKMLKDNPSYQARGKIKCEWAESIGACLDIHNNKSPSFQRFVHEIEKRLIPMT